MSWGWVSSTLGRESWGCFLEAELNGFNKSRLFFFPQELLIWNG
ncbi:hypothetical protein M595_1904 [Lyngbya aestuarii BL J]|uniref:Uncharacterized protein n=1 Tax=Lyngbya aestuarii BL J TaxID=1348334 RepID=U7QJC9_9CYAN|nr:hypothetical protein M595_1904 [Lyngbya aestuarii BL J]